LKFLLKKKILIEFLTSISLIILGINFIAFSAFQQGDDDSSIFKSILRFVVAGLLFLIIVIKNKVNYFYLIFFPLIAIFFLLNSNVFTLNFLYILLIVYAFSGFDYDKILKKFFYIYIAMCIVHLVFLKTGYIVNTYFEYDGRFRASYGFGNVNKLGMMYFNFGLISLYVLLNNPRKYELFLSIFSIVISVFFIVASDSRTSLIVFLLVSFIYFINKFKIFSKILIYFYKYIFYFCIVITLVVSSYIGRYYNELLSNRPEMFGNYFTELMGFPYILFGYYGSPEYPVDNSYLVLMGAIGPILFLLIFIIILFFSKKSNISSAHVPIFFGLLLFGIFENNLLRVELLLPIVLFNYLLPRNRA